MQALIPLLPLIFWKMPSLSLKEQLLQEVFPCHQLWVTAIQFFLHSTYTWYCHCHFTCLWPLIQAPVVSLQAQSFVLSCFSRVQLFVTPWTVAWQSPLSMGFCRQEYWSGLPCPPLGLSTVCSTPTTVPRKYPWLPANSHFFPSVFTSLILFWHQQFWKTKGHLTVTPALRSHHFCIGSKLGKEYVKAVYCHPAYLTSMQSTSWETLGWMEHKLESRLPGEISITSDMQVTPPLWQKVRKN